MRIQTGKELVAAPPFCPVPEGRLMAFRAAVLTGTALAAILIGCSKQDQEKADEANAKAKAEAKKLTAEAKQEAHKLGDDIKQGMNGPVSTSTAEAGRKLRDAGHKVDHATLVARVKTKLATDAGLSTATSVRVDAEGSVITLSGTATTADAKRAAEQAAASVDGVSRVVNNIVVQP
jgi:osmotically-inducible protein OsmY